MKIDITSSLVEKGFDTAKNFLGKILSPTLEETGLLLKDQVSRFRFNNQVNILLKAQANCKAKGIDPKQINFKILCPLLDSAGLESEEVLQSVWADLLTNMADPQKSLENHIFPYLLSQLSKEEWLAISDSLSSHRKQAEVHAEELEELRILTDRKVAKINREITSLKTSQSALSLTESRKKVTELERERDQLKRKLTDKRNFSIYNIELIYKLIAKEYQYANLLRLGLIRRVPNYYTTIDGSKIAGTVESSWNSSDYDDKYGFSGDRVELNLEGLKIGVEEEDDRMYLSDLGVLFVDACSA